MLENTNRKHYIRVIGLLLLCTVTGWLFQRLSDTDLISEPETKSVVKPLVSPICDHLIRLEISKVDGFGRNPGIKPGDRVCIEAGVRSTLKLMNLQGTPEKPIVVINSGGTVVIRSSPADYAVIHIQNSEHIRLTGIGVSDRCGSAYPAAEQNCGIVLVGGSRGVAGTDKTGHIEIDHIEIQNPLKMGLTVKSTEKTGVTRFDWTQYNTSLHHNFVQRAGTEGVYVGSSFYNTRSDPLLKGVDISHNLIIHTGWDGLQVGSAVENCRIHHNRIIQVSLENHPKQQSGIMNNRGSVCHIYNNFILEGAGRGIYIQGNGGNRVFNNVIVRPGQQGNDRGDGIVVTQGSNIGSSVFVWHNTIIEPRRYGIYFKSNQGEHNQIQNNIIVNPGRLAKAGMNAYIRTNGLKNITVSNNLYHESISEAGFTNPEGDNYSLLPDSPAIDAGLKLMNNSIMSDYRAASRPQGYGFDIGAYEYISTVRTGAFYLPLIEKRINQKHALIDQE